jgi:hypothetical protein
MMQRDDFPKKFPAKDEPRYSSRSCPCLPLSSLLATLMILTVKSGIFERGILDCGKI